VGWRSVLVDRWVLASVGALVYWTTIEALRPMVALQLDRIGASAPEIGIAVGAYAVLGLLLSVPGGVIVDRVGPRRLLVSGFGLLATCGVLYAALATSVVALTVVQLVAGAAALAVWVALQSAVTYAGAGDFLRKQLAVFATAWAIGSAVGPLVGGWLFGWLGFEAVAGLLLVAGLVGALAGGRLPVGDPRDAGAAPLPAWRSARDLVARPTVRLVLASSFVSLAVQSLRTSFYPLFLADRGLTPATIGAVLTLIGIASVAVRLFLPALGRSFGARAVLVWSTWLAVAWVTAAPLLTGSLGILAGAVLLGVSLGLNPPTTVELIADATPPEHRGTAMGLRVAANRSAMITEPILFGAVTAALSATVAFVASGALLGIVFAAFLRAGGGASTGAHRPTGRSRANV
jgi:MFS family permease